MQFKPIKAFSLFYINEAMEKLYKRIRAVQNSSLSVNIADNYANDTAAATGGIAIGDAYHTNGVVKIRIA